MPWEAFQRDLQLWIHKNLVYIMLSRIQSDDYFIRIVGHYSNYGLFFSISYHTHFAFYKILLLQAELF